MARAIEEWALTAVSLVLLCASVACKKTDEPAPAAALSASTEQAAAASAALAQAAAAASAAQAAAAASVSAATPAPSVAPPAPVLGEVKRFPDKEKAATGSTKISLEAKIFNEPDASTPSVATLPKDLSVTRLATLGADWVLVQFPSGVGKVSPGWVEAKSLVTAVSAASTKPPTSASAATAAPSAAPAAVASAVPAPSASAVKVRPKPGVLRAPGR